ncbi:MAG: hypothetical protein MNSN_06470 [Minisyncoccus archaeiphilus]|jgi:hypothetical protein|uniref:hypothetical protein n=1 Tax=Minisyncoccus archaeiphilus TaxID=3238481 RepID=UPI0009CE380B|nr:MAG: hypothetical protein BWY21_01205 [Parcubacteria group bacterium ADurb.Bin216]GMX59642.1 MAG: hypothetical protein MNSN_06470 [Candidatus Parcubacteria bacterium]
MTITEVVTFLTSDTLNSFLLPFKIIAVLTAIAFVWGANYYYRKQELNILDWRRKYNHFFHQTSPDDVKTIPQRFQIVIDHLNKKTQLETKTALLKNGFLIQDILKKLEIPVETLEEVSSDKLPNARDFKLLLEIADRVRQDPAYSVNIEKVRDLFISMRDSLLEVGVL